MRHRQFQGVGGGNHPVVIGDERFQLTAVRLGRHDMDGIQSAEGVRPNLAGLIEKVVGHRQQIERANLFRSSLDCGWTMTPHGTG